MARFSILFIGLLLFFLNLHAQEETMSESERQEQLAKSDSLFAQGEELCHSGDYSQAIRLGTEALNIREKILGKGHHDYALALCYLSNYYAALGNYDEAIKLCTEAKDIFERSSGSENHYYAMSLARLSNLYAMLGNYDEAIKLCTEAKDIFKKSLESDGSYYATSVKCLSEYYAAVKSYTEAISYCTEAINIFEEVYGKYHPDYATSLSNLASYYYFLGNYSEAIRLGTEALDIRKKILPKDHPDYAIFIGRLSEYYSALGNYAEALKLCTEAKDIIEKSAGRESPEYAQSLNILANYNSSLGNYYEAVRLGTEALDIQEKVLGKEHPNYAISQGRLSEYYSLLGNYAEALRLCTEAKDIFEKSRGKESPEYAQSLNDLANYNYSMGNYSEAIRLGTEALNIREIIYSRDNPVYAVSLGLLSNYYSAAGNYNEAIRLGIETKDIFEKSRGKESPEYAQSLNDLANYNSSLGNYSEAIRLCTEAMNILEKVLGKEHPVYAQSLDNLASYNSILGNYQEAIRLCTEALNIREKALGKEHPDYATSLNNLASHYSILGNYQEAIKLGTEAMSIQEKAYGTEHPLYANSLNNLAKFYYMLGNYIEAVKLGTEALHIRERILGKEHPDYATSLNDLASFYADLGNYAEAIRVCTEAMNIREKVFGKEHPEYANSLLNMAKCNNSLGDYAEAVRLGSEAKDIYKKVVGKEHKSYCTTLMILSASYHAMGNDSMSIQLNEETIDILGRMYGTNDLIYNIALLVSVSNDIATGSVNDSTTAEAVQLFEKAASVIGISLGESSPLYVLSSGNLNLLRGAQQQNIQASINSLEKTKDIIAQKLGKTNDTYIGLLPSLINLYWAERLDSISPLGYSMTPLESLSNETSGILQEILKSNFVNFTSYQRSQFWEKYRGWYECWSHCLAFTFPSDTLVTNGYNGILISKGLLLNSDIEFSKLIQESGDSEALDMYEDLKMLRLQINKLLEKPISERFANVDSLERIAQEKETALIERSKVYGDFTKNLVITWPQVQEKLAEGDAAVEFVSFPWNADSTMYIAYVLRKDWDCPRMIPLFEEKELEAVKGYDYYTTPSVSHLVWEPLEEALEGAEHVYFSPGGDLYNIAIESVPDHADPAHIVSERRDYYRLSSTRELALIQDDYTWTEGAVYGGLDYNMGVGSLAEDEAHYAQSSSEGQRERGVDLSYYYLGGESLAEGIRSDRKSSGLLDSLPGTREEAVAIKAQLDDISVPSSLYTDDLGTEASFKALDGQRKSIIHIGTHGFFNTKKTEYQDPTSLLMTSSQQSVRVEDDALSRSGLCMAGANNLLTNAEALPDSLDDGWLTALEIAHLDLRGLDMVVLSACKTGVGEVTGDGVFGLQRGFKKAGARTLVMSLWNVPDQLTCYFMKEFFARIEVDANGHPTNKHAAFLQAQQAARTHWQEVDHYAASYDWAAFILLDGVD